MCCKAVFCCKTANTVTKEQDLAQIKLAAQTAQSAKGNTDAQLEATTTNFAEAVPESAALLPTE